MYYSEVYRNDHSVNYYLHTSGIKSCTLWCNDWSYIFDNIREIVNNNSTIIESVRLKGFFESEGIFICITDINNTRMKYELIIRTVNNDIVMLFKKRYNSDNDLYKEVSNRIKKLLSSKEVETAVQTLYNEGLYEYVKDRIGIRINLDRIIR